MKSNRFRRPKESIVKKAGKAKTQFKIPVPMDANSALDSLKPDWVKMVVESIENKISS